MDPPFCILEELEKMLNIKRLLKYFLVDMLERALWGGLICLRELGSLGLSPRLET
jgi:hypothetical protein